MRHSTNHSSKQLRLRGSRDIQSFLPQQKSGNPDPTRYLITKLKEAAREPSPENSALGPFFGKKGLRSVHMLRAETGRHTHIA